jgi:multiple sugar transport system ATP-binding protein
MAEIRLENVSKSYHGVPALRDVSLTFADGSFTSVFGSPGSGKSVLLRLVLGLEQVDSGRILIDRQDMTRSAPLERGLAMVFQNLALFPHLTARENIAFPLRRRGSAEAEIDKRIAALCDVLGIGHILAKKPAALSGGERQRVAIGRALVRDAAAYLMDEPIAALDARLRDGMRVELKRLQSELGKTFIYVTHDCDEAMAVADSLAVLDGGEIVQSGTPDAVYAEPATLAVAELIGAPRPSVFQAQITAEGIDFALGRLPGKGATAEGSVVVALRPENVSLEPGSGAVTATVLDIERLGAFSIVTVGHGGSRLRTIATGDTTLSLGAAVSVDVAPEGILLFTADTGRRIA